MKLELEPVPAVATRLLWKREGRRQGRVLVVASCPEFGTRDTEITDATQFEEEVMTHLLRLRDDGRIHIAFDRAGTSTSSPHDTMVFAIASALRMGVRNASTIGRMFFAS